MEISYNSLILPQGQSVSALYDNSVKGALFEEAIAATLYARYLILSNYDYNASVKLVDLIPADYSKDSPLTHAEVRNPFASICVTEVYVCIQVQLRGVVKTTHRLNAKSTAAFEELFNKRYISVDIGNSEFADVILPVSIDGKQDQFFIGIQAKNTVSKVHMTIINYLRRNTRRSCSQTQSECCKIRTSSTWHFYQGQNVNLEPFVKAMSM